MGNKSNDFWANIAKGFLKKLASDKDARRFEKISWLQEKKVKHLDDYKEKQIRLSGYQIHYKKPYELLHTYEDIFQKEIYRFSAQSPNPLIIDCGSNIGFSILYFKKIYPDSKILSFEADEDNFVLLKKNIQQNNLQNVDLRNKAVWIHSDGVQFSAKGTEASKISVGNSEHTKTVLSERLSNVLASYNTIDFLKMDIEGAEYAVINDCKDYLARIENMFIEYHGTVEETEKLITLLDIFDKSGFRVYIKNAADFLKHPFLDKKVNSIYDVQLNIFCYK